MPETTNGTDDATSVSIDVEAVRQQVFTTPTAAMNERRRAVERILDEAFRASQGFRYTSVYLASTYDSDSQNTVFDGKISVHIALENKEKERAGTLSFTLPAGSTVSWNPAPQSVEV